MSRAKRLWRVEGERGRQTLRRDYQTFRAAIHRAIVWRGHGFTATIYRSKPVEFEAEPVMVEKPPFELPTERITT